jgi:hypothetical protein
VGVRRPREPLISPQHLRQHNAGIRAGAPSPCGQADSRCPAGSGILNRMSGKDQHYLPAALIGGFGQPAANGKLREARVAVRRKATGAVDTGFPKAEKLAYRPGMYRLAAPPAGVDAGVEVAGAA